MSFQLAEQLIILAALSSTSFNAILWSLFGLLRLIHESSSAAPEQEVNLRMPEVAAVIAARNEESALPHCLKAVTLIMPGTNVFVGNDASTDGTARIARDFGCNVYTAPVNLGKSKVLDATIRHFKLCTKYRAVLILDADSQVDPHFLRNGLPILGQRGVAVVAGHVISRRPVGGGFAQIIHNYRKRLNLILQTLFRFGQSWAPLNFTIVAPGFASLYRSEVISELNIAEPGLVIEDINMTFELHKKFLGRVAYSPRVRCTTEDPLNLHDYSRQMRRWSLGLWQTMAKQGVWLGKFWLFLSAYVAELLLSALSYAVLAVLTLWALLTSPNETFWVPTLGGFILVPIIYLPFIALLTDVFVSMIAAAVSRDWRILLYAPLFPILRAVDIYWFLVTIPLAAFTKSDGRWASPVRNLGKS